MKEFLILLFYISRSAQSPRSRLPDCFGKIHRLNLFATSHIGNGKGNFQYAIIFRAVNERRSLAMRNICKPT